MSSAWVGTYRESGKGSNRGQWSVVIAMLCAVLCVRRTGKCVEVTEAFAHVFDGKSPAYNIAHARLSSGAIRSNKGFWESVQIIAMTDVTVKGSIATGTLDTRATFSKGARVFVAPAE